MFVNVNTNPQAPDSFKELFRRILMFAVMYFSVLFCFFLAVLLFAGIFWLAGVFD